MQNILNDAGLTLRATADLLGQQAAELAAVGVATSVSAQNAQTNADDIAQSLHADLPALAGIPELAAAADAQRACVAALRAYGDRLNNLSAVLMNSAIRLDGARYAIVGGGEPTPPATPPEPSPLPTYEEIQAEADSWREEAAPLDESIGKTIDDTAAATVTAAEGWAFVDSHPDHSLAEDLAVEGDESMDYPAAGELLVGGEPCLGCGRPCPADRGEYRRCPDCLEKEAMRAKWDHSMDRTGYAREGDLRVGAVPHPGGGYAVQVDRTVGVGSQRDLLPDQHPDIETAQKAALDYLAAENSARNQPSPIPEPADDLHEPITETDERCPGCGELLAYPGELEAGQCRDCQEDVAAGRVAGAWHPNHNAPGALVTADPDEDDPEAAREEKPRGKGKGASKKGKARSPRGKGSRPQQCRASGLKQRD